MITVHVRCVVYLHGDSAEPSLEELSGPLFH